MGETWDFPWFIMANPKITWMIWGVHPFSETSKGWERWMKWFVLGVLHFQTKAHGTIQESSRVLGCWIVLIIRWLWSFSWRDQWFVGAKGRQHVHTCTSLFILTDLVLDLICVWYIWMAGKDFCFECPEAILVFVHWLEMTITSRVDGS